MNKIFFSNFWLFPKILTIFPQILTFPLKILTLRGNFGIKAKTKNKTVQTNNTSQNSHGTERLDTNCMESHEQYTCLHFREMKLYSSWSDPTLIQIISFSDKKVASQFFHPLPRISPVFWKLSYWSVWKCKSCLNYVKTFSSRERSAVFLYCTQFKNKPMCFEHQSFKQTSESFK